MLERQEGKWLIAVSGGPDSMALLHMCIAAGTEAEAAHVNYHQRAAADEEERYVRSWCASRGIVCHVLNGPFVSTGNFEADAREWRYAFFFSLVKARGLTGIMTAHHQDDLLETYIMQKEKNLIPAWYGIRRETVRDGVRLLRPLLAFTKADLERYCREHGIRYYIDHTNLEPVHTRNIIRQNMQGLSAAARSRLLQEAEARNRHLERIRRAADGLRQEGGISLAAYRQAEEEVRLTALRSLLDPSGTRHFSRRHLQETDGILMRHEDFLIPLQDREIVQNRGIAAVRQKPGPYAYVLTELSPCVSEWFVIAREGKADERVTVDADELPLTVRSVQPGDTIRMRYGHKKVNRFFIDRHIPRGLRASWPVVLNRTGEIILVPGLGCAADHWDRTCEVFVRAKAIQ